MALERAFIECEFKNHALDFTYLYMVFGMRSNVNLVFNYTHSNATSAIPCLRAHYAISKHLKCYHDQIPFARTSPGCGGFMRTNSLYTVIKWFRITAHRRWLRLKLLFIWEKMICVRILYLFVCMCESILSDRECIQQHHDIHHLPLNIPAARK